MSVAPGAEVVALLAGQVVARRALGPGQRLVVGRGEEADLSIDDDAASRRHLLLEVDARGLQATDLGSRNGTLVAGARLAPYEPRRLSDADRLTIGQHVVEARLVGPSLPAGRALQDDYEALHELGRGGGGVVRAARHRTSGRVVAVKTFDLRHATPTERARFRQEAELRLASPHVVQTLEVRDEDDRVHLVMELLEGGSLADRVARGPLPIADALALVTHVAEALVAAHAQGVVHRDVKPANILFTLDGVAKLGDFGIARVAGSQLTATALGLGTLAYVAPEQAESARRAGPAADLYALGATLYHLLAGKPPLDTDGPDALERVLAAAPAPLQALRPDCPSAVAALVHRLLEKEPADRLPGAAALLAKLRELAKAARPC